MGHWGNFKSCDITRTHYILLMAIMFSSVKVISRSTGLRSAVASAAYRHNATMKSVIDGKTYEQEGKDDVIHSEISIPDVAPDWVRKAYADVPVMTELECYDGPIGEQKAYISKLSERLWNDIEIHEERHNRRKHTAQLARAFTIALPNNLTFKNQINLARNYIKCSFADRGMIADWVIHNKNTSDVQNAYMHIMLTMRDLGTDGWGLKNRDWNIRSYIDTWRREWAERANIAMYRAGLDERIDHRSYVDQGINLLATSYNPHIAATAEANNKTAFEKEQAVEAWTKNEEYLRANPEHILIVLSAQLAAFTAEDIRVALQERMDVPNEELENHLARVMASKDLVNLSEASPDSQVRFSTKARMDMENKMIVSANEPLLTEYANS